MNVPPSGSPSPVASANALMLKRKGEVDALTRDWLEKLGGSLNTRKTYLGILSSN